MLHCSGVPPPAVGAISIHYLRGKLLREHTRPSRQYETGLGVARLKSGLVSSFFLDEKNELRNSQLSAKKLKFLIHKLHF